VCRLRLSRLHRYSSPTDSKLFDSTDLSPLEPERLEIFHSLVAKALYLATKIRHDLLPVIFFLTSRVLCGSDEDWGKLRRMMSYVAKTVNHDLFYRLGAPAELVAYIDASHETHLEDSTSRTGIVITLAGGAVSFKSSRQRIVTLSSTEAEIVALTEGTNYVIWLRNLMYGLRLIDLGPTVVYKDNLSTISLVSNDKTKQQRTGHLNCKYCTLLCVNASLIAM
jgi:hypothetical protein